MSEVAPATPLLHVTDLVSGYGEAVVVDGISFELAAGQSMAVLGRNGVGKTTLLNSIIGVTQRRHGKIALAGRDVTQLAAEKRAQAGIGWVPQERNIFRSLTVEETSLPSRGRGLGRWTVPTNCFRASNSGVAISAANSPAANSKCSRLLAR